MTKAASDIQTHMHLLACITAATMLSLTHSINITTPVVAGKKILCVYQTLINAALFSKHNINRDKGAACRVYTFDVTSHAIALPAKTRTSLLCNLMQPCCQKKKVRDQGCAFTDSRPWTQGDGQPKHWSGDEMANGSNQSMTWESRHNSCLTDFLLYKHYKLAAAENESNLN